MFIGCDCQVCEAPVQFMYGFNRVLCDGTPIPTFFPVLTCEYCGETYFTLAELMYLESVANEKS